MRIEPCLPPEARRNPAAMIRELRHAPHYRHQLTRDRQFRELAAVPSACGGWGLEWFMRTAVAGWRNANPTDASSSDPQVAIEVTQDFVGHEAEAPDLLSSVVARAEADGMRFDALEVVVEERPVPYEGYMEAYLVVGDQQLVGDVQYHADIRRCHDGFRQAQLLTQEDQEAFKTYLALRARFEGKAA